MAGMEKIKYVAVLCLCHPATIVNLNIFFLKKGITLGYPCLSLMQESPT